MGGKQWGIWITEEKLWTEAQKIETAHGELAPGWIAEQIVCTMRTGKRAGEERVRRIDTMVAQLRYGDLQGGVPQRSPSKLL